MHIFSRSWHALCVFAASSDWLISISTFCDWLRFQDSHQKTTSLENVIQLFYFLGSYCSQKLVKFKGVHRVWNSGHIADYIVEICVKFILHLLG